MLSVPEPEKIRRAKDSDFTREFEYNGDTASAVIRGEEGSVNEGTALEFLQTQGLTPEDWEVSAFRRSIWTMGNGEEGESVRFSFSRRAAQSSLGIDELLAIVNKPSKVTRPKAKKKGQAFVLALGDMQIGKSDGDGPEGTLRRTLSAIDSATDALRASGATRAHIAWLGDHLEGFVSQGGANAWRTTLTLTEQMRLTRRVMLYAVDKIAPLVGALTCTAVPGNHGETIRFSGKGKTRYDDSYDTDALISVAEATALNKEKYGHVKFFVPERDELTTVVDVAGTIVGHAHGHQWRKGKHMDWWRGQDFNGHDVGRSDLLLSGHLHHLLVDTEGQRTFIQVPSLESESTWYRHVNGTVGAPGVITLLTRNGEWSELNIVK